MKIIRLLLLICIIFLGFNNAAFSQVEDTLVLKDSIIKLKLDKKLIKLTKEVVLKHGPGYYREYKAPVIKYRYVSENTVDLHPSVIEKNMGRVYYTVEYPYDRGEESFARFYSAKVYFWEDLTIFHVSFGHGMGIRDYDKLSEAEKQKIFIPYEKVRPLVKVLDTVRDEKGNIIEIWHRYERKK